MITRGHRARPGGWGRADQRSTLAANASSHSARAPSLSVWLPGRRRRRTPAESRCRGCVRRSRSSRSWTSSSASSGRARVEVEDHEPRRAQSEPRGEAADDHLGDQHLARLAGPAELADVGPTVVPSTTPGSSGLAQRRDVAGDGDPPSAAGGSTRTGVSSGEPARSLPRRRSRPGPRAGRARAGCRRRSGDERTRRPASVRGATRARRDAGCSSRSRTTSYARGRPARSAPSRSPGSYFQCSRDRRAAPPVAPSARRR